MKSLLMQTEKNVYHYLMSRENITINTNIKIQLSIVVIDIFCLYVKSYIPTSQMRCVFMTWNKLQFYTCDVHLHPFSRHNWQYIWFLKTILCSSIYPVIFLFINNGFYISKWWVDRFLHKVMHTTILNVIHSGIITTSYLIWWDYYNYCPIQTIHLVELKPNINEKGKHCDSFDFSLANLFSKLNSHYKACRYMWQAHII